MNHKILSDDVLAQAASWRDDGRPVVKGEDTISREIYANEYDLVVLATGMEPSTPNTSDP